MKTPKASTPAVKSKLNTPRSGFIKKGSDSVKKMKFNVLNSEVSKSNNSTPKIIKSEISQKLLENLGSGKKGKSPFNNSGTQIGGKKSPKKKKVSVESEAVKSNTVMKAETTPKPGKQNSPTAKLKQNKASPEVELGLNIEQYLNKNSKSKIKNGAEQSTPSGKKQINNPKHSPTLKEKIPSNQPVGNQAKKRKGPPNQKNNSKETKISVDTNELVDKVTLTKAVKALIKYIDGNPKDKNEMLGPNIPLLLQIDFIKQTHALRSRLSVPHSLVYENSDICLFIADKGKKEEELDDLVDELKQRLKNCGINCITEILPWKRALREHTQFEQKKKLMNRFDFFLIENKLAKIRAGLTDKFVPKKWPIAVCLDSESKLKDNIEKALKKIPLALKRKGLTKTFQFGHYKMTVDQLVENLDTITKALCDQSLFFGGRDNIRSLNIKTGRSIAFPLFVATKSSNLVKNPPKEESEEDEGIEGELTTLPGKIVKVFKDGTVKTKRIKSGEDSTIKKQNKKVKKEVALKKEESDDDEEEMESDIDEEEEDDSDDDDEVSEDEEVDSEEGDDDEEEEEDDDEDEEDEDEDDEDEDEEDEDYEDNMSGEEEDLKAKLSRLLTKTQMQNKKGKKRKQDSETDEDELEEAELSFLKELRKQQDEIEAQAKKQFKAQSMGKKFDPKNKKKKPNQQETSNNFVSRKTTIPDGQATLKRKQLMMANNQKKNEDNTNFSKNARRGRNQKNKHNKNANTSPTFTKKNQNKTKPGGKKFIAKG